MKPEKVIAGKYVLIVDDEQDVLDTLVELLDMAKLDTASSFSDAKKLLEENEYESIAQMQASMSQKSVSDPGAFERANYMRVLRSFAAY